MKRQLQFFLLLFLIIQGISGQDLLTKKDLSAPVFSSKKITSSNGYITVGYGDTLTSSLGLSSTTSYTVEAYVKIPKETLNKYVGSQLTRIKVALGGGNLSNGKIVLADDINSPAFYTQSATLTTSAWTEVTLTTPYTIVAGKDLYIGYGGTALGYFLGIDKYNADAGASYLKYGALAATNLIPLTGYGNLTILGYIEGANLPQNEVELSSISVPNHVSPKENFTISGTIKNDASKPVQSIEVTTQVGTESPQISTISGLNIPNHTSYTFTTSPISISANGEYQVRVTVTKVNAADDEDSSNNSASSSIVVFPTSSAPTIVSTTPSNKNVVIEEFTGINCTYCPDGHKTGNQIAAANPGRVVLVNIHQGSYANTTPDLRTEWGDAIAAQTGLEGYPAATINRHQFAEETVTATSDRQEWADKADTILATPSPVNLGARATLDWATRKLVVYVEGYYTDNSKTSSNLLNVAVLQDNILGPQVGASSFYPENLTSSGLYKHNHVLRDLLTGQWGESINTTTKGSFFSKAYVYTIPDSIRENDVNLRNLKAVAYIAEGRQEVITGTEATIENTYLSTPNIKLESAEQQISQTGDDKVLVKVGLLNLSKDNITSYTINYSIDNVTTGSYTVDNANILPGDTSSVLLTPISTKLNADNNLVLSVVKVNAINPTVNSSYRLSVRKDLGYAKGATLTLKLWQDRYGSETSWKIFDTDGTSTLTSGGPYSDLSSSTTKLNTATITIPKDGTYRFEIYDEYGDGFNTGYGSGKYEIYDGTNTLVLSSDASFTNKEVKYITVDLASTSIETTTNSDINVYIDKNNRLQIVSPYKINNVTVVDLSGRKVIEDSSTSAELSVAGLNSGLYLVRVQTEQGEKTAKLRK